VFADEPEDGRFRVGRERRRLAAAAAVQRFAVFAVLELLLRHLGKLLG
jgi:hypothetical protein